MKSIFLSGATGMLGSLVGFLHLQKPDSRLVAFVRPTSENAHARLLRSLRFWGAVDPIRIEVAVGDITCPQFGLDGESFKKIARDIDAIIHCAADLRLDQQAESGIRNSTAAVENILQLADASGCQKIEHVSTVGVGGAHPRVAEETFDFPRRYRNGYEASKAAAEFQMAKAISQGVPITIHRPSMIVGHSVSGASPRGQVFSYLCKFLSGKKTRGFVPNLSKIRLDTVPCDYVASVILASAARPEWAGLVLHECSANRALSVSELAKRVAETFEHPLPTQIPTSLFLLAAECWVWAMRRKTESAKLKFILPYLKNDQIFENGQTLRLIANTGIHFPPPERYLQNVLEHLKQARNQRVEPPQPASAVLKSR